MIYFLLLCVYVYACMYIYMCMPHMWGGPEKVKKVLNPLELKVLAVVVMNHLMWMLGIKLKASIKAESTLNC